MTVDNKPKFLLVDDDASNTLILKKMLGHIASIDLANTGSEAIRLFSQSIKDNCAYDVVFLDILMPEIDGHEVLNQIRSLEQAHNVVPGDGTKVIMVTSLDDENAIFESHVSGCEGYLIKPFSRSQVQDKLLELGFWVEQ